MGDLTLVPVYAQTSVRTIKGEMLWFRRLFSSSAARCLITGAVLDCGNFDLTAISDPDFTDFTDFTFNELALISFGALVHGQAGAQTIAQLTFSDLAGGFLTFIVHWKPFPTFAY